MRALFNKSYRSNSENILSEGLIKETNSKQNDSCAECFDANFEQKKELRTEFLTSLSFLTIRANLMQNDGCAECFDANFEQQDSCARSFGQVFAF